MSISRKKTTSWNLFFLYLNIIIGFVKGIIIVPLYLKYIDNSLYSAWLATGNLLVWLTLVDPGVGDVLMQKVSNAYAKQDLKSIKYQISSSVILSIIISGLCLIGALIISNYLGVILKLNNELDVGILISAFQITAISTSLTLLSFAFTGAIIGFQRTKEIGIVRNTTSLISVVIILLLLKNYGILAIAYSALIQSILAIIGYILILLSLMKKERIGFGYNRQFLFSYSKIFTFTFLSKLTTTIANNIDLILVSRFISVDTVAILELTRRPLKFVNSFINQPSVALTPGLAHLYGEGDYDKLKNVILRFGRILVWSSFIIIFGFITFNSTLIQLWVGDKFFIGQEYNIIICISFLLVTINSGLSNFTYSFGEIKNNSIVDSIKSIIFILLLFLLGNFFGLLGIILAPLISILFPALPYYIQRTLHLSRMNKKEYMGIIKEVGKSLIIIIPLSIVFRIFEIHSWSGLIYFSLFYLIAEITLLTIISKSFKEELTKLFLRLIKIFGRGN